MEDRLKWLRGPLPPLTESILTSGLVPNVKVSTSSSASHIEPQSPNPTKNSKNPPAKIVQEKYQDKDPLRKFLQHNSSPQAPNIGNHYKPQPIEALYMQGSKTNLIKPEHIIMIDEHKGGNARDEITSIAQELDDALSAFNNVNPNVSPMEQMEMQEKLFQIYTYAFNRIILFEKSNYSDKAKLLRRVQQFYSGILPRIDYIVGQFTQAIEPLQNSISLLTQEKDHLIEQIEVFQTSIVDCHKKIADLELRNANLIKESNDKDVVISNMQFDNDFAQGQIKQLQFNINQNTNRIESLDQSLAKSNEEIISQIKQNEALSEEIEKLRAGDMGYIKLYHDSLLTIEEMKKTIDIKDKEIYDLTHIEKCDISVDTSDMVGIEKKKKKEIPITLSKSKMATISASKSSLTKGDLNEARKKQNNSSQMLMTNISMLMKTKEVQTDDSLMKDNQNKSAPEIDESKFATQIPDQKPLEKFYPPNYDIDTERLNSIPQLLTMMVTYFCQPYTLPNATDLSVITFKNKDLILKSTKPLPWILHMMNEFLLDPTVRSIENRFRSSIESILTEWLSAKYKLQHLVNQAFADVSYCLNKYESTNGMVQLFNEILTGVYSFFEFSFISTIYSFSIDFTFPNMNSILKTTIGNDYLEPSQIHVECAISILSKCFPETMVTPFFSDYSIYSNSMVDFSEFLRISGKAFGEKHKLLSFQTRDLLWLCNCTDVGSISYDSFRRFMTYLKIEGNPKDEWNILVSSNDEGALSYINVSQLLRFCTDRKTPLIDLLSLKPLSPFINQLKQAPRMTVNMYQEFSDRFTRRLPKVIKMLPNSLIQEIQPLYDNIRAALLECDVPRVLWMYRVFLFEIDRKLIDIKGTIPFSKNIRDNTYGQLIEYFNTAESVAFALI